MRMGNHHWQGVGAPSTRISPSAPTHELGGSIVEASSFKSFCPAFDAWESINRYVDEHSERIRQGVVKE